MRPSCRCSSHARSLTVNNYLVKQKRIIKNIPREVREPLRYLSSVPSLVEGRIDSARLNSHVCSGNGGGRVWTRPGGGSCVLTRQGGGSGGGRVEIVVVMVVVILEVVVA
jgi:hypothetical protein